MSFSFHLAKGLTANTNWKLALLSLALVGSALGQSTTGLPPFSTIQSGLYDSVKINDGAILITLPVRSKSGVIPFSYSLNTNVDVQTYQYYALVSQGTSAWVPQTSVGFSPNVFVAGVSTLAKCPNGTTPTVRYSNYNLTDELGGLHALPTLHADSAACYPETLSAGTTDGSGYAATLQSSGAELNITDRAGDTLTRETLTDPNNNAISFTSVCSPSDCGAAGEAFTVTLKYTDSTGETPLTETLTYTAGSSAHLTTDSHSWTDAAGKTQSFTVNYSAYSVKTSFGCGSIGEYPLDQSSAGTQWLPSSISSPEGSYVISYETAGGYTTGRISKIGLPGGASIGYTFTGGNGGITCGSTGTSPLLVPILTRTLTDTQGAQHVWKYDTTQGTNETVVTDPSGNDTVYTFAPGVPGKSYYETQRQIYQGSHTSGTLLKTVLTCYNNNTSNCTTTEVTGQVLQKSVYTTFSGMTQSFLSNTTYDNLGDLTEDKEYDFTGTLLSDRVITYGTYSNGACTPTTIGSRVCTDRTQVATTPFSQTNNSYDARGNLTSTSRWVSGSTGTGGNYVTSSTTYNSNGTVNVATDVNGATTTYGPLANYTCNGNFPTKVSEPQNLSKSMTWDCNGGVITSVTDENSQKTAYAYVNSTSGVADPFYRLLSASTPPDPTVYVTNYTYTPTTFESAMNFNGAVSTSDSLTTTDGFGNTLYAQARQGQGSSTFDTAQNVYDANFRLNTSSIPCGAAASKPCTTPVTTTTYDGLNRPVQTTDAGTGYVKYNYAPSGKYQNDVLVSVGPPPTSENAKRRQLEYDGLGRLTSVCELTSTANGGGSCAQAYTQTGYWTKYTYNALGEITGVSQNAQSTPQTRSYSYDGLGRLTSETNPESGTTTYTYDSLPAGTVGSCSTGAVSFPGQLMLTKFANGNTVCYLYDGLNRVTDENGENSGGTNPSCKRFRYDSSANGVVSPPSGYITGYPAGRIAEAETDNCIGGSPITDEWFSYDALGNMTDMWEMTPHSGMYYHSQATFFGNGAINTLNLANPSTYTQTYTVDGEGRPSTLSTSASTTPMVSGVTFNAASQPTNIQIGAVTDQDTYVYDPNTGRMTNWTFEVNSVQETGALYWNPDWTPEYLIVTDGFNSGGTQTCYFNPSGGSGPGYDDLGRLLNDNCGSVWSQTFSYDNFGNISKSGSVSWACPTCYNGNNQYNVTLSSSISYDSSGNLLQDPYHTYIWNAYGKISSVDSTDCGASGHCVTYDAFGRAVEITNNYQNFPVWYTQLGKTAFMQTNNVVEYAYWPAPGGGTLLENFTGSSFVYMHKDWLGNARIISTIKGRTVEVDQAFAPYGETYATFGSASQQDNMFTGDTEDIVGTSDCCFDTPNRELSTGQGRWLSPDPAGLGAVDVTNPQSWNRYAYVLNNPLSNIDPLGLDCVRDNGDGTTTTFTDDQDNCEGDNGFYFDGTATNAGVDANGNVWASVNGGPEQCSGDCPVSSVTVNGGSPSMVDTITSTLTGVGNQVLNTAQNAGAAALNWLLTPRNPGCMAGATAAGAGTGALVGGGIGSLGFAGGPAGLATTPAGVATGSFVGGGVGFAGGMIYCAKGVGPGFGGNQRQNRQARDAQQDAERQTGKKMTAGQQETFHDMITGQGLNYHQMVEVAVQILNGVAY